LPLSLYLRKSSAFPIVAEFENRGYAAALGNKRGDIARKTECSLRVKQSFTANRAAKPPLTDWFQNRLARRFANKDNEKTDDSTFDPDPSHHRTVY
jgi:hypothetical protein